MHPDSPIQGFDLDGTPSRGAQIALDWWCEHCVSDHVATILSNGKYVQWAGDTPPDGSVLQYSAGDNVWLNVDPSMLPPNQELQATVNNQAAQIADMQQQLAALADCCSGNSSNGSNPSTPSGSTTTTTTVHDLVVTGPDANGNYVLSGTAPQGPDSYGNYGITSLGVTGPDARSNYVLTTH